MNNLTKIILLNIRILKFELIKIQNNNFKSYKDEFMTK